MNLEQRETFVHLQSHAIVLRSYVQHLRQLIEQQIILPALADGYMQRVERHATAIERIAGELAQADQISSDDEIVADDVGSALSEEPFVQPDPTIIYWNHWQQTIVAQDVDSGRGNVSVLCRE